MGPHARRIYLPLLEKYCKRKKITVSLLIDLEDQSNVISEYLKGVELKIGEVLFLNTSHRNSERISDEALFKLGEFKKRKLVDKMIISTEPKAHKAYLQWAIDNNVDVLIDKPLTSPIDCCNNLLSAKQIFADFSCLQKSLKNSKSKITVQVQRRYHPGYLSIRKYIEDFIKKYQIPISFLDIYHADGMWNMPNEFFSRENHPYKYGYGKLMHSGYHFIDLLAFFLEAENKLLPTCKKIDNVTMFVQTFSPEDFFKQIGIDDYSSLFGEDTVCDFAKYLKHTKVKQLGEIDIYATIQFRHQDTVITTASVNLLQNSFSRRAWTDLPKDTYKGNGRVRHERLNMQLSSLLNVQVHSYQSHEINKKSTVVSGEGSENHFDITYYRNSDLVGGKTFEKNPYGENAYLKNNKKEYKGHNESAREKCFLDFIEGKTPNSCFDDQRVTVLLLSKMYECIYLGRHGKVPYIEFKLKI